MDARLKKRGTKQRGAKKGQDRWTAVVPLSKDADGKWRQYRFTFVGNKRDADRALTAELAQIGEGTFVTPERSTFGDYLTAWLKTNRTRYAAKTWERYDSLAKIHIIPALGDVPLQRLTASHLNRAYSAWRDAKLKGQTVLHHHRLIHRVLASALREGRIRANVAAIADKPKAERHERRHFSIDEIVRIIGVAPARLWRALIILALATGARRGELLGLKWVDVDLGRGVIAIRRSLEQTKQSGVCEKSPKSGKERVVDLPATAVEVLRRHRAEQGAIGGSYMFPGVDGAPWTPHKVTDGFREILRQAKVKGGSFHSLRHTAATQMLELEVAPKVVQERLGHSTIAITMDLYSHVTPSMQAEAARRQDEVLRLLLRET